MIRPDLIELASREEKIEFILQELSCNPDVAGTDSRNTAATFFSHMYNIRFSVKEWDKEIWPKYLEAKDGPIVEPESL